PFARAAVEFTQPHHDGAGAAAVGTLETQRLARRHAGAETDQALRRIRPEAQEVAVALVLPARIQPGRLSRQAGGRLAPGDGPAQVDHQPVLDAAHGLDRRFAAADLAQPAAERAGQEAALDALPGEPVPRQGRAAQVDRIQVRIDEVAALLFRDAVADV